LCLHALEREAGHNTPLGAYRQMNPT
jgi:hypothetical protein